MSPSPRNPIESDPMKSSRTITVIGAHAEGEVGKVITGGVLPPPGASVYEQQQWLMQNNDALRKFLLYEPRGGAFTHANLVVPAKDPAADAGFIIMEPDDYPPMSGSNCICVATVPCYAAILDAEIKVPDIGTVRVDVGYGGAFFVIVDAREFGFKLRPEEARQLVETGERIKEAARQQLEVQHPEIAAFNKIAFTEFTLPVTSEGGVSTGRNTVVISPGKLDRSPCGTGTCARLAVMHAKNEISAGEGFVSRSIIDSRFDAKIESVTRLKDGTAAILPSISGRAWITGIHSYLLDPS